MADWTITDATKDAHPNGTTHIFTLSNGTETRFAMLDHVGRNLYNVLDPETIPGLTRSYFPTIIAAKSAILDALNASS